MHCKSARMKLSLQNLAGLFYTTLYKLRVTATFVISLSRFLKNPPRKLISAAMKVFLAASFAITGLALLPAISLAIDNTRPRRDVDGQLMDVHDGNVIKGTD